MNNWIYSNTKDNRLRFVLGEKGERPLFCIGINPSTAEPNNLDNTLRNVKRTASDLGYDSWIMINIYPQRATNPNELDKHLNFVYHNQNMDNIEYVFLDYDKIDIWTAWGALITKRIFLIKCLKNIFELSNKFKTNWYSIGQKSKNGHPHHPLYLKKELPLDRFDIEDYIDRYRYK